MSLPYRLTHAIDYRTDYGLLYAAMRVRRVTFERAIHARVYGHAVEALQAALLGTALLASLAHVVSTLDVLSR